MQYKLTKGNKSNYEVELIILENDFINYKQKVLTDFQKDFKMNGFRPGKVPLNIVEENIQPQYLTIGIYEEIIHHGINHILKENNNIKLIGQIYDLNPTQNEEKNTIINFKIDVYPEVIVNNDEWKNIKIDKIDENVTENEINNTINQLLKQFAEYEKTETINEDTVFKINMNYKDNDGNIVDKGKIMIGKEEMNEFEILKKLFIGKKVGDKFEENYDEQNMPILIKCLKEGLKIKTVEFEIYDVEIIKLPELSEENIKKFFGNEKINNENELKQKIKELINEEKRKNQLLTIIDKYLEESQKSLEITIPKSILEDEINARIKSLENRFGNKQNFEKYIEKLSSEEKTNFYKEIEESSNVSLKKFFIFKKLIELNGIEKDVNWEKQLDAEEKLYMKLSK